MDIVIPLEDENSKDDKPSVWEEFVPIVQTNDEYHIYMLDEISQPYNYAKLTHLLYTADASEVVNLHVNTVGGDLSSVVQICGAMGVCKAKVVVHLAGQVYSGGTFITMYADELRVAPNTRFMIHNYSGGIGGKGNEVKAEQAFMEDYAPALYRDVYAGFLTPEEIELVLDDKDKWMSTEEVLKRWNRKQNRT